MTLTDRTAATTAAAPAPVSGQKLYSAVIGVTSLVVFFQSVWAGMFIREGDTYDDGDAPTWVSIHDWAARLAFVLAIVATVIAVRSLRTRKDLLIGTIVLTVAILAESFIGGAIGDHQNLTAVHIPLAMVIVAMCVWLPLRSRRGGRVTAQL